MKKGTPTENIETQMHISDYYVNHTQTNWKSLKEMAMFLDAINYQNRTTNT
jgi:hypothetical protein